MDPNQQHAPHKYIKVDPSLPHLVEEHEKKVSYIKSLFIGRINRRNYFVGSILAAIAPVAGALILILNIALFSSTSTVSYKDATGQVLQQTNVPAPHTVVSKVITPIALIIVVIDTLLAIPFLASVIIRRLHDLNKSGWLGLLLFVPLVNVFIKFYLVLAPGTKGENQYGATPLPRLNLKQDVLQLVTKESSVA